MSTYTADITREYAIQIAGISILAKAGGDDFELEVPPAYGKFKNVTNNPDIELTVYYKKPPALTDCDNLIFDSGFTWKLYESGDNYIFTIDNPISGPGIYRFIRFNKSFTKGELFVKPCDFVEDRKSPNGKPMIFPFEYPLDELLIVNKFADGSGVDIHGCAVAYDQAGVLFIGVSGAGKSTLANLWKAKPVEILSDDRLIVKPVNGEFWVFGTPWHGDAKVSLPSGVPLKGMYFIVKSSENQIRRLSHSEAVTRLLVCCFPTFYFKGRMESTIKLLEDITQSVPVYEFSFVPNESAVSFIMNHSDA